MLGHSLGVELSVYAGVFIYFLTAELWHCLSVRWCLQEWVSLKSLCKASFMLFREPYRTYSGSNDCCTWLLGSATLSSTLHPPPSVPAHAHWCSSLVFFASYMRCITSCVTNRWSPSHTDCTAASSWIRYPHWKYHNTYLHKCFIVAFGRLLCASFFSPVLHFTFSFHFTGPFFSLCSPLLCSPFNVSCCSHHQWFLHRKGQRITYSNFLPSPVWPGFHLPSCHPSASPAACSLTVPADCSSYCAFQSHVKTEVFKASRQHVCFINVKPRTLTWAFSWLQHLLHSSLWIWLLRCFCSLKLYRLWDKIRETFIYLCLTWINKW